MRTVTTKEELAEALKKKEPIRVTGPLAEKLKRQAKTRKAAKIGGIVTIAASIAAIPFTGGASAAGVAAGAAAVAGATISLTAAELAILLGGAVAIYGISKGCKITLQKDGSVIVEPK